MDGPRLCVGRQGAARHIGGKEQHRPGRILGPVVLFEEQQQRQQEEQRQEEQQQEEQQQIIGQQQVGV